MNDSSGDNLSASAIERIIDSFLDIFEKEASADPEIKKSLRGSTSFEQHRILMKRHMQAMYGQITPSESSELAEKVAKAHIANDVRLSWYVVSYNKVFGAYHQIQSSGAADLPDLESFRNLWLRDMGETLDGYYELAAQRHHQESEILQKSLEKLDVQAKTDPLTEILNRRGLREAIDADVSSGAFLLFDLDRFKSVNDLQGHIVGDDILQEIAAGLSQKLRSRDLIGRIGGDEFAVWLNGAGLADQAELTHTVKRIVSDISFEKWDIAISCGVAFRPTHATTFSELYGLADSALYRAKTFGDFSLCIHGSSDRTEVTP